MGGWPYCRNYWHWLNLCVACETLQQLMFVTKQFAVSGKNALDIFHLLKELWPNNAVGQHFTPPARTAIHSIVLYSCMVARRALTNHGTQLCCRKFSNKPANYSLVEWRVNFTRSWQFLHNASIFAVQNFGERRSFSSHLATRLQIQWMMAVWFWSFCCNCKPVDC